MLSTQTPKRNATNLNGFERGLSEEENVERGLSSG